jgi:3-oxoacyl-[acyl-carrier protein] reductase
MGLLDGKTAIITGAGRGIGAEIARRFSSEGAAIAVHYNLSKSSGKALAASLPNAMAFHADLSSQADSQRLIDEVIAHFGKIDILVNCAASFIHDIPFEVDSWESYRAEFEGVFGATFHITKAALPHMKANGGGRIINFTATLTDRPLSGYGAHTSAKGAVLAFTKVIAKELGSLGIRVNAISPGMTLTQYSLNRSNEVRQNVASRTPLGRIATPADVADAALYLASDLSAFITGAVIAPDGGLSGL